MATPHITDPFAAIQAAINSGNSNKVRILACMDGLYFGIDTFGPMSSDVPNQPVDASKNPLFAPNAVTGTEKHASKSLEECCDELKACCPDIKDDKGMKAVDWSNLWKTVAPLLFSILQRLIVA